MQLSDLQKLLRCFNGTAIVAFVKTLFVPSAAVFPNNLAIYLKDLTLLLIALPALKLVTSSFE